VKRFVKDCACGFWPEELVFSDANVTDVCWNRSLAEGDVDVDLNLGSCRSVAGGRHTASAWADVSNKVSAIGPDVRKLPNLSTYV
jgi:hypothetical protein